MFFSEVQASVLQSRIVEPEIEPKKQNTENIADQPEAIAVVATQVTTVAAFGKRQSLRAIRRELQEGELTNPGVQRLILEDLETAERECEALGEYVERFHEADKRAAVLEEKLRTNTALEILFAVGIGMGFVILGLAPYFWDATLRGPAALCVGAVLIVGSVVGRVVKR
jgi:hypothetical protein